MKTLLTLLAALTLTACGSGGGTPSTTVNNYYQLPAGSYSTPPVVGAESVELYIKIDSSGIVTNAASLSGANLSQATNIQQTSTQSPQLTLTINNQSYSISNASTQESMIVANVNGQSVVFSPINTVSPQNNTSVTQNPVTIQSSTSSSNQTQGQGQGQVQKEVVSQSDGKDNGKEDDKKQQLLQLQR